MSEEQIPEMSDKFADQVVEMISDEHVEDLARMAMETPDVPPKEKLAIAVSSGVYLGARVAFQLQQAELIRQAQIIGETLKGFDKALQKTDDNDQMMILADLRRPIAKFLEDQRKSTLDYVALHIESKTMVPAHVIQGSTPPDQMDRTEVFALGGAIGMNVPRAFAGFLMFGDDPEMECKCLHHLQERFLAWGKPPSEVPPSDDAYEDMHRFGVHMILYARTLYAKNVEAVDANGAGSITSFTPQEAEVAAKDVMAKMTASGKKE